MEPGGVTFRADWDTLAAVHRGSWIAGRVLVRLGRVGAASLEALAGGVRSLPWKDLIVPRQLVEVEVSKTGNPICRADAAERKVGFAIADAMRGPRLEGPRPPKEPARVQVRLVGDKATVSLDASGERLHRRGWREQTAKAPLRENLAAAILAASGWDGTTPLVDPMCGSGTFVIDGARRAIGLSPRVDRTYAWEMWPSAPRRRADPPPPRRRPPLLLAADRDAGAVNATQGNARRAGVSDAVRAVQTPFEDLMPPAPSGLLVCNPPYGQRIGEGSWLPWERWGELITSRWAGWRVAWLLPEPWDGRRIGLPGQPALRFENGGIPVRLYVGDIR